MTTQIHDQEANSLPVKQVDGTQHTFFGKRFTDLQRVQVLESNARPRAPRNLDSNDGPDTGVQSLTTDGWLQILVNGTWTCEATTMAVFSCL